ncbi:MAG TPA: sialidase family protein, partial [Gemmatimonadales bacterium]
MTRAAMGTALAALAAALACRGPAEQGGMSRVHWNAATAIAKDMGGAAPIFAVSPAGQVTLAWVSAPGAGSDGRLFVRPDARTEQTAELRDPMGSLSIYGEVPPKIAYGPDGTLYAAYLVTKVVPGMRWPQNALRFARSRDGGRHWEAPSTVTGDAVFGSYDDHALFVAPDGSIYLSWLAEVKPDTSHTFFARSTDGGRTWSTPQTVDSDRSCPCCRTALAAGPDGSLYLAWRKRFPGDERDIVVARSRDRGVTWSDPARVHADTWQVNYCPDAGPSIKVGRDGTLHVAWWTGRTGRAGTQYAQSRDGGVTFSAPVPLGL